MNVRLARADTRYPSYRVLLGGTLVGVVSLRGGFFSAEYPAEGGNVAYSAWPDGGDAAAPVELRRHLVFGSEALIRTARGELPRTNFAQLPNLSVEVVTRTGRDDALSSPR